MKVYKFLNYICLFIPCFVLLCVTVFILLMFINTGVSVHNITERVTNGNRNVSGVICSTGTGDNHIIHADYVVNCAGELRDF